MLAVAYRSQSHMREWQLDGAFKDRRASPRLTDHPGTPHLVNVTLALCAAPPEPIAVTVAT